MGLLVDVSHPSSCCCLLQAPRECAEYSEKSELVKVIQSGPWIWGQMESACCSMLCSGTWEWCGAHLHKRYLETPACHLPTVSPWQSLQRWDCIPGPPPSALQSVTAQLLFQNGKNDAIVKESLSWDSDFVQCQGVMASSIPGPCVIVVVLCSQEKFLPDDLFGDVGRDLCHCTHKFKHWMFTSILIWHGKLPSPLTEQF